MKVLYKLLINVANNKTAKQVAEDIKFIIESETDRYCEVLNIEIMKDRR